MRTRREGSAQSWSCQAREEGIRYLKLFPVLISAAPGFSEPISWVMCLSLEWETAHLMREINWSGQAGVCGLATPPLPAPTNLTLPLSCQCPPHARLAPVPNQLLKGGKKAAQEVMPTVNIAQSAWGRADQGTAAWKGWK